MSKLHLDPAQGSLSGKHGAEHVAVQLAGGASRMRRDQLGAAALVDIEWYLDAAGYDYLMAFYRASAAHGSLPFTLDLVLDKAALAEYTARFVPDTLALSAVKGTCYIVGAQIEVIPLAENNAADLALIAAYEAAHP